MNLRIHLNPLIDMSMFDEEEAQKRRYIKVSVKGKDSVIWDTFYEKFLKMLSGLLETEINSEDHTSFIDETKIFTNEILKFGKEKLRQQGIENQKTIAEIEELYSKRQLNIAEAKLKQAEARFKEAQSAELEFKNKINDIKLSIGLMKAFLIQDQSDDAILFVKQIDLFIKSIETFNNNSFLSE